MTRRYLLGDRYERDKIDKLLMRRSPYVVNYEYAYLCDSFLETLIDQRAKDIFDFEFHLSEFIDDFEMDIRETYGLHRADLTGYLVDVRDSMSYFLKYLEQVDFLPAPKTAKVMEGSRNTVLLFEVYDPQQPRPTFSTKRH